MLETTPVYGMRRADMPALATLDHFLAKSLGGSDDPSNFRLAHSGCNSMRGSSNIVGVPLVML